MSRASSPGAGARRVVWTDGLYLRPQHLQQLERSVESRVDARLAMLPLGSGDATAGGFVHLRLDSAALVAGRVAVSAARGVMPDGTPFAIPDDAPAPPPLEWPADLRERHALLVLPLARPGRVEFAFDGTPEASQARWLARDATVPCGVLADTEPAEMALGELQLRLAAEGVVPEGCCGLPLARVVERRAGGGLVLDDEWIAPSLDCRAVPPLQALLSSALHLLRHRADALAAGLPGATAAAGDPEALRLLQALNRHEAALAHLSDRDRAPPEALHALLAQAAGELATFDERRGRRLRGLPPWRHADPRASLAPLLAELRLLLADVLDPHGVQLALRPRGPGLYTALVSDAAWWREGRVVLVAGAQVPEDLLRRRVPAQFKIGPPDQLRDLVRQHLPAIELRPLSVAPPRLPYYAGATYFELVREGPLWSRVEASRVLALHVAGDFPGLRLELWALRA